MNRSVNPNFFLCVRARARVRVCVCVCERERERERARVCKYACVCAPTCLHVWVWSSTWAGCPQSIVPYFFLSKYLLVDSIVIAKTFGWFSLTFKLATHSSVAARHWLTALWGAAAVLLSVWNLYNVVFKWLKLQIFLVWYLTFLLFSGQKKRKLWLTFWATSPPKSNPWRPRRGGG